MLRQVTPTAGVLLAPNPGPMTLDADHPLQFAAQDKGPTPVEYVLVGLGACLTAGVAAVAHALIPAKPAPPVTRVLLGALPIQQAPVVMGDIAPCTPATKPADK